MVSISQITRNYCTACGKETIFVANNCLECKAPFDPKAGVVQLNPALYGFAYATKGRGKKGGFVRSPFNPPLKPTRSRKGVPRASSRPKAAPPPAPSRPRGLSSRHRH